MTYLQNPPSVEAVQFLGGEKEWSDTPDWLDEALGNDRVTLIHNDFVRVAPTDDSMMPGDWLIRDYKGDLSVLKDEYFNAATKNIASEELNGIESPETSLFPAEVA